MNARMSAKERKAIASEFIAAFGLLVTETGASLVDDKACLGSYTHALKTRAGNYYFVLSDDSSECAQYIGALVCGRFENVRAGYELVGKLCNRFSGKCNYSLERPSEMPQIASFFKSWI